MQWNKRNIVHLVATIVFALVALRLGLLAFTAQAGQVNVFYLIFGFVWVLLIVREGLRWKKDLDADQQDEK